MNEEKTAVVNMREESFTFLGFTVKIARSQRTGREFPFTRPSKGALRDIKAEIRNLISRKNLGLPKEDVIKMLNHKIRGWTEYYRYGHCTKELSALKWFIEERMKIYMRRKQKRKNRSYNRYPYSYLYEELGLYKIPTSAPWTQTAKACGGR